MYTSILGFAVAACITGVVVLSPEQQPPSLASIFEQQEAQRDESARALTEKKVSLPRDAKVVEALQNAVQEVGAHLVLYPDELEANGVDQNRQVEIDLTDVPLNLALDRVLTTVGLAEAFNWQAHGNTIEIRPKEVFDARELTLVSYNIGDIIKSMTVYGRAYDHAVADITSLLRDIVEPEAWRENGGTLAQLRVVGGRMFVQAPKRMHQRIEWILQQLREDQGKDDQPNDAAADATHRTTLRPGDCLTVSIFELWQPNQWFEIRRVVDGDGLISIPEVGELKVSGMKRAQVVEALTGALRDKVMKSPQVQVEFHIENALAKQASANAETVNPEQAKWELARLNLQLQKAKDHLALIESSVNSGQVPRAELVEAQYAVKSAELEVTAFMAQAKP